jgi:hypothetical protein
MALANRIDALKCEVIKFIDESRAIEVHAIQSAMERRSVSGPIPATALAIIASSVALSLSREVQLGIKAGHGDITAVIEAFIANLEP